MPAERAEANGELAEIVQHLADMADPSGPPASKRRCGILSARLHMLTSSHPLAKDDCPYCMGEG